MELAKKVLRFLSSILFYSVVLILGIALLMFLASFIDKKISMKNGEYRSPLFGAYVIISESMVPHINVYDAVVTVRVDDETIEVDDIITFISKEIETAGTPITHRVIGIVYEDETKEKIIGFRTKGDHNNTADFALIAPDEVIGKVFMRIPMIGYLQTIMTKPIGWLLIVVIPCLLMIGSDIFKLVKASQNKDDDSPPSNNTSPRDLNDMQKEISDSLGPIIANDQINIVTGESPPIQIQKSSDLNLTNSVNLSNPINMLDSANSIDSVNVVTPTSTVDSVSSTNSVDNNSTSIVNNDFNDSDENNII